MTAINAALQQAFIALQVYLGQPDYSHQTAVNYQSSPTLQAAVIDSTTETIPISTTDQAVNLATLFPSCQTCQFIVVQDITNPGQPFSFTTVAGSGRLSVGAGGFVAWQANGGLPPTIYLTNPSSATPSVIKIFVMSQ